MQSKTPKTTGQQFIFFPKGGDPCFASNSELTFMLAFIEHNPQTTFLMQTKNPQFLLARESFPDNLILGITLETDKEAFGVPTLNNGPNPSLYSIYHQISKAPLPRERVHHFVHVKHKRKAVTIEPILAFSPLFAAFIEAIEPEFIYVGYDTKGCKLPEPTLAKTKRLISELSGRYDVRLKTMREAWWYNDLKHCDIENQREKR
jgi:hypothetical protein